MDNVFIKYIPDTWKQDIGISNNITVQVSCYTKEYNLINRELKQAMNYHYKPINTLTRVQNLNSFGQMLLREQFLLSQNDGERHYYRLRRYITIQKKYLSNALKYNLDPRRCGLDSLKFCSDLSYVPQNEVIIVVQAICNNSRSTSISPLRSSEYFIEYIVDLY